MTSMTVSDAISSLKLREFKEAITRTEETIGGKHIRLNSLSRIIADMFDNNASAFMMEEAREFHMDAMAYLAQIGEPLTESEVLSACDKLFAHMSTGASIYPPGKAASGRIIGAIDSIFEVFPSININSQNKEGISLFMLSVGTYNFSIQWIERQLNNGANIHLQSKDYGKALHFVPFELGQTPHKLLQTLLEAGSDPMEELDFQYFKMSPYKHNGEKINTRYRNFYDLAHQMTKDYEVTIQLTSNGGQSNIKVMELLNRYKAAHDAQASVGNLIKHRKHNGI